MQYHHIKCQYCPNIVERSMQTRKATCFPCRDARQRAYAKARTISAKKAEKRGK